MENQNPTGSRTFFESEKIKAKALGDAAHHTFNELAILRLGAFAGILLTVFLWNQTGQAFFGIGTCIALVAFLVLMRRQQSVRRDRDFQYNLADINAEELDKLDFHFSRKDSGVQHQEKDHAFASDLDIFGDYSLYKLLNRTRTSEGSRRLADWLKNHATQSEVVLRQEAAGEISSSPAFIQNWEATALLHKKAAGDVDALRHWTNKQLSPKLATALHWRWWSLVTVVIAILAALKMIPGSVIFFSLAVHLFIIRQFQATVMSVANQTAALGKTLVAYSELLHHAEQATFQSAWWIARSRKLAGASAAIRQVGTQFERLDYRNNAYFFLFVSIPFLWDLHCLHALEKWKQTHRHDLADWLDVLADVEAINSLAGHAFANADHVRPVVTDASDMRIVTQAMGHPLIPAGKRVSNDFSLSGTGHTMLVTGSNMSGKSTFLRTIGLNLVLAQMGAVVSAVHFECTGLRVFSSMRTQDSLEESTSSFYAELKRLRSLLDLAAGTESNPVFYLLDEILKGTNSADRHRGAEALIRQLHQLNASGLVSTHDLELGEWGETEIYVHNAHFRSDMENGKLHFDYRLHDGICRSFNASELMRMMGIDIDLTQKRPETN